MEKGNKTNFSKSGVSNINKNGTVLEKPKTITKKNENKTSVNTNLNMNNKTKTDKVTEDKFKGKGVSMFDDAKNTLSNIEDLYKNLG